MSYTVINKPVTLYVNEQTVVILNEPETPLSVEVPMSQPMISGKAENLTRSQLRKNINKTQIRTQQYNKKMCNDRY